MEIQDYLLEREKMLEENVSRLRDMRVFDFNYIPEKPLMRDEVKPIIDALIRSNGKQSWKPRVTWCTGSWI